MSDDEFLMDDAADEDYDFDYESDDAEADDADVENTYYNAKSKKRDEPEAALAEWRRLVDAESPKGDWGFKALKQSTKLNFARGRHADALVTYEELLGYTKSAVTRNYSEKSINNILDYVSAATSVDAPAASTSAATLDLSVMERFYEVTKTALESTKNERLSIKTDLKLARLWLARKEWGRLGKTLKGLRAHCEDAAGDSDGSRGTVLLEVFAIEIQMYDEIKDFRKLKETYDATLSVKSAIPHPRIMGVIRECGGKMHMAEKEWALAQIDFFQSFLSYDEAGSAQRITVLKYLVLAHMLMGSDINPFDSQETKSYKNDPQIVAMTNLVAAYQRREVHEAEKILRENRATIMDDPFIRAHIDEVLKGLRTQYLIDLVRPYTRVELSFLARHLNIPRAEVEELLMALILDGRVSGRIDGVRAQLTLLPRTGAGAGADAGKTLSARRYAALTRWTNQVQRLGDMLEEKQAAGVGGGGVVGAAALGMGGGMGGRGGPVQRVR
ncbi:putative COP9 signalosome complex subunit 2 [Tilletiopsis washingtonensis]|uniref:COP9 signalosome complex subunit 2 n=1 Tax=Tilletiopsis washingtonensis TaxID=58919 RepID=A0A316Z481_9BASI|nr:putative COP9 signalosome complex subunit 2 [Tilletiopsis washingtonensis]PWN94983.1 putative COP9 signalosome complex subunit 2 [Tilletiopsis washingtonensis]